MKPIEPIHTIELFPELSTELLSLLKDLSRTDWDKETACAAWSVQDVVAHLLGGTLSRLTYGRDRHARTHANTPLKEFSELLDFINQRNAEWVDAARRISPSLLIEFLEITEPQLYHYFKALPPDEASGPAVAWAGDAQSPNWFDIAREYTEKWLHQQHIREAVGQPVLAERKWLGPVLDTFMRALPYTYRNAKSVDDSAIAFHITGEAGGNWSLIRHNDEWQLFTGEVAQPVSTVRLDQDIAWRLFTKGISQEAARANIQTEGNMELGLRLLQMVSIMA
jgi:uncharacterized protein (TIGR03083 family)